jgi:hypothetical protein
VAKESACEKVAVNIESCRVGAEAKTEPENYPRICTTDFWRPQRDLNPCLRRERAMSMAIRNQNGESDGTRTRGFLPDRQAF